jgi:uncharacterized delta-60 repeat protein
VKARRAVTVAVVAAIVVAAALPAHAAGELDTTFSGDGKVFTDFFGENHDEIFDAVRQSDGKLVVVGSWGGGAVRTNFAVMRYHASGSIDTSFGSGGRVMTDFDGDDDVARSVVMQPDGKILVAGWTRIGTRTPDFALARYLPDGSLDPAFSGDGRLVTNLGGTDRAVDVLVQPNGSIVAVGYSNVYGGDDDVAVVRYYPNGRLDPSFSGDGKVYAGLGADDLPQAAVLQPNGKILVVGFRSEDAEDECFGCNDFDLLFARFNGNGSLDSTFDGDGKKTEGLGDDEWLSAVTLMPDGRFVVSGGMQLYDMYAARHMPNGSLDRSFGIDGRKWVRLGRYSSAEGVAIQQDGKIVLGGSSITDFAVVRLHPSGLIDKTFSGDGIVRTDFGGTDRASAMVVQPDGRIVLAGDRYREGDDNDFILARYLP